MKKIYYVEVLDVDNDIDWLPIVAFTSEVKAKIFAEKRNAEELGKIYAVQSLIVIQ